MNNFGKLICVVLCLYSLLNAQPSESTSGPEVHSYPQWILMDGTVNDEYVYDVTTDGSGNVYVVGTTEASLHGKTHGGYKDFYILKYDSLGQLQWTVQEGETYNDWVYGVASDGNGNIAVAGVTVNSLYGLNSGESDIIVVKYNTSGGKVWDLQTGTNLHDYASDVAMDSTGNVYVTGYTLGSLHGYTNADPSGNSYDTFLVKYDSAGNELWTTMIGSTTDDYGEDVAVDGSGNIYITGYTYGDLDGNLNAGLRDFFVVKYDSSGTKQWTRMLGTSGTDEATGIAVDKDGNIYVTGFTDQGLDGNINAGFGSDMFLVKYNSSGVKLWTRQMGTSNFDWAYDVKVDIMGNAYLAGVTQGSLDGNWYDGQGDLFIVKYSPNGEKQWTRQNGGNNSMDQAYGIALDTHGRLYVAGMTDGAFGAVSGDGGLHIFLMKYDGWYEWSDQSGSATNDEAEDLATDNSGNVYMTGWTKMGSIDGNTLAGVEDLFLMKYDSTGLKKWTRQLGVPGETSTKAYGLAVDQADGIYVCGVTDGGLDGNINSGFLDLFLVKYNGGGNKQWTKQLGSVQDDAASGVAVDGNGDLFVTGYTYGDLDGNSNADVTYSTRDLFLVKYHSSGLKQWTHQLGSSVDDQATAVVADGAGNIYVTGYTDGDLDGNTNAGFADVFLVKYDSAGLKQWTRQLGTNQVDEAHGIAVDGIGNIYVTGHTYGAFVQSNSGGADFFLAKYDSSGALNWVEQLGTSFDDFGYSVEVDMSREVIFVGGKTEEFFDGNYNTYGSPDILLVEFDLSGEMQWGRVMGTKLDDSSRGLSIDPSGDVFMAGTTAGPFDGHILIGEQDAVILKFDTALDIDAPMGSITIDAGASFTNNVLADLELTCVDPGGCREMQFSNDSQHWSVPETYAISKSSWDITDPAYGGTADNGTKTVYARFMDNAGNWSDSYNDDITLDTMLPIGTVTINSDEAYTDDDVVSLVITGNDLNGIAEMQFSNDGANWSVAQPYDQSEAWQLETGDGGKTVYAKVKDNAGNWSDPFSDTIIVDTTPAGTTADPIPGGGTFNAAQDVTLTCVDGSGVACGAVYYTTDGSTPTILSKQYTEPVTLDEDTTLKFFSVDHLGHEETVQALVYDFDQAPTNLSLTLSAPRILNGGSVDAVGQLLRIPEDNESRSGLTVRFEITGPMEEPLPPVQTTETLTYTDSGLYNYTIGGMFNTEGTYNIKVVFDGTGLLLNTESVVTSLQVGPSPGYAIIVEGKIVGGAGLASHNKTTNRIYTKLKERGFTDDDIYYFNYDTGQTGVDETPTKSAVQTAVTFWAKILMNSNAAPLYIIMNNHGDGTDGIYLESESITPSDLNGWLNTLETGLDAEALQKKRVVIVGACYSGAFIPVVSKTGRVVISSSAADEVSHKGPYENDGGTEVRSGEFFLEELFTFLQRGYTIREAFEEATERTEIYTRKDSTSADAPPYYDNARQHPLLDDDGDGTGTNDLTSTGDGSEVDDLYLGIGDYYVPNDVNNPAELTGVTGTVQLGDGSLPADTSYTMWADVNDDVKIDNSRIWYEVRTPDKVLGAGSGSNQAVAEYDWNFLISQGSQHWELEYTDFTQWGKYEIYYFVRDAATQKVSPMKRSIVYKDRTGNNPPNAFDLLSPANNSDHDTVVLLAWQEATDPDSGGDPYCDGVSYRVELSKNPGFSTLDYVKDEIEASSLYIDHDAGLEDGETYYWRVWAVDNCGSERVNTSQRSFNYTIEINNPNPEGFLNGYIRDAVTLEIIAYAGATVSTSDGATANTVANGAYVMLHESGTYTLDVTGVPGYEDRTGVPFKMVLKPNPNPPPANVVEALELHVYMTPACTPVTEICDGADNDCDAEIDEGFPDTDNDGVADCVDSDDDNDGILDVSDTCPVNMPAKIGGVEYPTIWDAYTNANTDDTIRCQDIIYAGDFTADRNITVTIEGGYDCDYSTVTGTTTIEGKMTIEDGKVIVEDVDVAEP